MPVCVGPSASAVYVAPSLTLDSSTNYNQNSGVLNATVATTGNKPITSVEFQWSTSSTFASGNSAWTVASTNTIINQGSTNTARNVSISGLPNNTTHYVRFRTTNASGFIVTSSIGASFKTYKLNTSTFTGSSTWSNPVPTSGTSGLAITQLLNLDARAGGGGGGGIFTDGHGGGAGERKTQASATISGNVTVTVGAGGAYLSSDATGTSIGSVLSASPGQTGNDYASNERAGSSGNGNQGGLRLDISGGYYSGGGGGGTNGAGGNGYQSGSNYIGGAGGAGWATGYGVGGQGGDDFHGSTPGGANTGNGGSEGNGGSGYAEFQYWGP